MAILTFLVPDRKARGSGYLVYSGSQWFAQGLVTDHVTLRHSTLVLSTDFRDDQLRLWLRKQLDLIQVGRVIKKYHGKVIVISVLKASSFLNHVRHFSFSVQSQNLEETGPKNCEGGKPAPSEVIPSYF